MVGSTLTKMRRPFSPLANAFEPLSAGERYHRCGSLSYWRTGSSVAIPEAMPHISDDSLEQYAMGTLPEPEMNVFEQHLLICEECQDGLKATDAYVVAMCSALKKHGKSEAKD